MKRRLSLFAAAFSRTPRMKFSLVTIAYVFALLAAGMAAFGPMGLFVGAGIVFFWVTMYRNPSSAFFWWLIGGMTATVVVLLLLPAIGSARGPALRNSCLNNLKQIGLALRWYHEKHGAYPPAYVVDADGKPMHSWRVLILPYLEHQTLYEAYDLDEPWDGPNNRKLWDQMPAVYMCPATQQARRAGLESSGESHEYAANYVAVVDGSTLWTGDAGVPSSAIKDGSDQTIQVLEYTGSTLPWTAPVDLTLDEAIAELTSDEAHGHWHVNPSYFAVNYERFYRLALFAEGHGKMLPQRLEPSIARELFTAAGGETVDLDSLDHRWRPNGRTLVRYDHVYAFAAFVGLALLPGVWLVRRAGRGEGSPAAR